MKSVVVRKILLASLASSALVGVSVPSFAQEAEAVDDGEIIVSARRRDESLQDTPVAITAVNAAMLENKAAVNVGDLTGAAPNLLITNQNSGAAAANLSIRGLTYADIEKSQEPTVGVVVDGVFIGTSTGQFFDFFDIEQIEVLRGPQGTLFGRNTIGGVINIKRTRPTGEFGGKAEVSYGKFNSLATRAVVNVPIINGKGLAAKFFYFHNETDGWYRNATTGKRAGGANNENFGASFLVQPEGSGFDAVLTVEKQIQQFDPTVANLTNSTELFCGFIPAAQCNRNTTDDVYTVFTLPAVSNYSAPAVSLEMNYDLGGVTLTSVSGWRKSRENQTQDFDASSTDLYYVRRRQNYKQLSQELRAAGKFGDTFDYVVGGYYFESDYQLIQHTRLFGFNPTVDPLIADTNAQSVNGATTSYAFFGDFNWAFAEKFRLSFGGRYTHDKKSLRNAFATTGVVGQGSGTFSKFTPKIGVDFRPNDDTMFYASWSRGYRSGGFSPRAATAATAGVAYQPETVDSYEIGTKLDLLDRKVQFNVAAFYSQYKDLHQNTTIPGGPTGNQTVTSNVGSAKIKGIEMDFTARPAEGFKINGSLGYLKSNFKGFIVGGTTPAGVLKPFDYSNNDMIYSPKFTASLSADYTVPTSFGDVIANIGYRHIDRYDQQISVGPATNFTTATVVVAGNDPRVRTSAQDLLDASLTTKFDIGNTEAKLTFWGRNLLNDKGTTHGFTVAGLWSFGTAREPRTYGATVGVKF
jgi:iron complex outermembrane receptor protein